MSKTAYFDCPTGLAGDMILAALIDSGAPLLQIERILKSLPLPAWQMQAQEVQKNGQRALSLHFSGGTEQRPRHLAEIEEILAAGDLSAAALSFSVRVFRRLAEVEAKVHNCDASEVHFHEVGALDSILDIAGIAVALDLLRVEQIYCSALPLFSGTVNSAHGVLSLPAPAVVELLRGMKVTATDFRGELITPTGAAVLSCALAPDGFTPPDFTVTACGFGAGDRDLPVANVLRVYLGETASDGDVVEVLCTALDDCPPELLGVLWDKAFAAGALDLQMAPVYMKKGRPATALTLLCRVGEANKLAELLFAETTTLGVRIHRERRLLLPRHSVTVETAYGPVAVKVAGNNAAPEFDSCRKAAQAAGVPVKEVFQAAVAAYLSRQGEKE